MTSSIYWEHIKNKIKKFDFCPTLYGCGHHSYISSFDMADVIQLSLLYVTLKYNKLLFFGWCQTNSTIFFLRTTEYAKLLMKFMHSTLDQRDIQEFLGCNPH